MRNSFISGLKGCYSWALAALPELPRQRSAQMFTVWGVMIFGELTGSPANTWAGVSRTDTAEQVQHG